MQTTTRCTRFAGLALLVGGITYLFAELIAARARPGYSYTRDYISDLGSPALSQWAWVMNAGFVVDGLLFAGAFAVIAQGLPGRHRSVVLVLAISHGVGEIVVGLVHSSPDGTPVLHGLGAGFAMVGGSLLMISAWWAPAPLWYRLVSAAVGSVALAAFLAFAFGVNVWDKGAVERLSVYSIIGFEMVTGALLLGRRPSRGLTRRLGVSAEGM